VCCSQNEVEGGEDEREVEQKDFQPYWSIMKARSCTAVSGLLHASYKPFHRFNMGEFR
jgi:hypothetical protein